MTRAAFRARLGQRGPALEYWPEAEREAALTLLARSWLARRLYAAALDADLPPAPDPAALARMQAGLRRRLAALPEAAARPAFLIPAGCGAVAACFAAGLWLGLTVPGPAADQGDLLSPLHVQPIWADAR